MQLWPVDVIKKVFQLVRVASFWCDFLQNPYFNKHVFRLFSTEMTFYRTASSNLSSAL